jgi:hypothetical protein
MTTRNLVIGLTVVAVVGAGAFGAWRLLRTKTPARERPIYNSSLCAFDEPKPSIEPGFCDKAEALEPPVGGCELTKEDRADHRSRVQSAVRGIQLVWGASLLSLHVIDRLETGEIEFSPELGQRILDATYGVAGVGRPPKAPVDRKAFVEVLKCSPRDWANSQMESLNQHYDKPLAELLARLPQPATVNQQLAKALSFLPRDE